MISRCVLDVVTIVSLLAHVLWGCCGLHGHLERNETVVIGTTVHAHCPELSDDDHGHHHGHKHDSDHEQSPNHHSDQCSFIAKLTSHRESTPVSLRYCIVLTTAVRCLELPSGFKSLELAAISVFPLDPVARHARLGVFLL